MCIQWCCKNCGDGCTILTHRWAQERCNDYYIARSRNGNTTDCPKGPWELRRAFHRHPYRGAQRCDECKRGGRKNAKRVQSARQKANVALGERPEYRGALHLGELEIPEHFHKNAQHLLEPGKVDAMKSNWESFNSANGHLPSHELEREWAKRFTALKDVGVNAGVWVQPLKPNASSFRQGMTSEEGHDRGNAAFAGGVPRSLHQHSQHLYKPTTYEPDETSRSARQHVQSDSFIQRPESTTLRQEFSQSASQQAQYNTSSDTHERSMATVEQAASQNMHQDQCRCNLSSGVKEKNYTTVEAEKEAVLRDSHPEANYHNSTSTTRSSSSSQSTRSRPWDL